MIPPAIGCAWCSRDRPWPRGGGITALTGSHHAGFAPGTYRAAFLDPVGGRALEFWNNHPDVSTSDPITVAAPNPTTIDAALRFPTPANDSFANAQTVTGVTGTTAGTNTGASKETGEPNHGGNTGGRSIWYGWTAPSTGTATFQTCGSDYDTTPRRLPRCCCQQPHLSGQQMTTTADSRAESSSLHFGTTIGLPSMVTRRLLGGLRRCGLELVVITAPPPLQATGGDQA